MSGSICFFAYSNSKEPISPALADINVYEMACYLTMQHYLCRFPKGFFVSLCVCVCVLGDIISSLHSLLDIINDEENVQLESIADDGELVNENSTQTPTLQLQL